MDKMNKMLSDPKRNNNFWNLDTNEKIIASCRKKTQRMGIWEFPAIDINYGVVSSSQERLREFIRNCTLETVYTPIFSEELRKFLEMEEAQKADSVLNLDSCYICLKRTRVGETAGFFVDPVHSLISEKQEKIAAFLNWTQSYEQWRPFPTRSFSPKSPPVPMNVELSFSRSPAASPREVSSGIPLSVEKRAIHAAVERGSCAACSARLDGYHVHRIVTGSNALENVVILCNECNRRRSSDVTLYEFILNFKLTPTDEKIRREVAARWLLQKMIAASAVSTADKAILEDSNVDVLDRAFHLMSLTVLK